MRVGSVRACVFMCALASATPAGPPPEIACPIAGVPGLSPPVPDADELFGVQIISEGDLVVISSLSIGGLGDLPVRIYDRLPDGTFQLAQELDRPGPMGAYEEFGFSIDLSGDVLAVGAPRAADGMGQEIGAAYVFRRDAGVWSFEQRLESSTPEVGARFGHDVAADGSRVIVGAPEELSGIGAAYAYTSNGQVWTQRQRLFDLTGILGERFGWSLDADDDLLAVGSNPDNPFDRGCVTVFERNGQLWGNDTDITGVSPPMFDGARYGFDVALRDGVLLIGAPGSSPGEGRVHAVVRDTNNPFDLTFAESTRYRPPVADASESMSFGSRVCTNGRFVLIADGASTPVAGEGVRVYVSDQDFLSPGFGGESPVDVELLTLPEPMTVFGLATGMCLLGESALVSESFGGAPAAVLRFDGIVDCNCTGLVDGCDILIGLSQDADADGVPDECAPFAWIDSFGGQFSDPANWAQGALPELCDTAVFDERAGFPAAPLVVVTNFEQFKSLDVDTNAIRFNLFSGDLIVKDVLAQNLSNVPPVDGTVRVSGPELFPGTPALIFANTGPDSQVINCDSLEIGMDAFEYGELRLNGDRSVLLLDGDATVGDAGEGLLRLQLGGEAFLTDDADLTLGLSPTGFGVLRNEGGRVELGRPFFLQPGQSVFTTVVVGDEGAGVIEVVDSGEVLVPNDGLRGSQFVVDEFVFAREAGSFGSLNILDGSTVDISADFLCFGDAGMCDVLVEDSALLTATFSQLFLGRELSSDTRITVRGQGAIWEERVNALTVGFGGPVTLTLEDGGTIAAPFVNIQPRGVVQGVGLIDLQATGVVGELFNFGDLRPGDTDDSPGTPGTLTVMGDYRQVGFAPGSGAESGTVTLDAGGFVRGTQDMLLVNGDAVIGGGFFVELDPASQPMPGESLELIRATSFEGRFDVAFFPGLGDTRFLRLNYGAPASEESGEPGEPGDAISVVVGTLSEVIDVNPDESFDTPGLATFAVSGDFDGDGDADLALSIPDPLDPTGAAGTVTVLTNGTVEGSPSLFIAGATVSYSVGVNPTGLAVGEFDQAPGMDIAVCNGGDPMDASADSVNVLMNNGAGVFAVSGAIPVGDRPTAVGASDFNGDGLTDLVVTNAGDATASVLFNASTFALDGERALQFNSGPMLPTGPEPSSVDPLDIDNGKDEDDIVVANAGNGTVTIFANLGGGVFGAPVVMSVDASPGRVRASDLNNDGFEEIVTTNLAGDTVSVLVNNAGSTFAPSVEVPAGDGPSSVALIDLDDDADLDIAIVTRDEAGEGVVRILRNDLVGGQIAFAPSGEFLNGANPVFVVADDFDGDAMNDLITVNDTLGGRGVAGEDLTLIRNAPLSPSVCAGDCNESGAVDFNDLVSMLFEFGNETAPPGCDADTSGAVNFNDLVAALFLFGPCP